MNTEERIRTSLRHRADEVIRPPDAWERIANAVDDSHAGISTRNRIMAGLVAAVIGVAGFAFVLQAFDRGGPSPLRPQTPPPTPSGSFGFAPTPGWHDVATDLEAPEDGANVAWAATLPFAQEDLSFAEADDGVIGIYTEPRTTIEALVPGQAVIVIVATTGAGEYPAEPNVNFESATSLGLPDEPRFETSWEGHGETSISRVMSWVTVDGWALDVRVYFGSRDPDPSLVASANQQLEAFTLPTPSGSSPVAQIVTGATPPAGAIVFTSSQNRRSGELVYTVPGTGTVTPMTDARSHGFVASGAAWSPDGSQIAFVVGTPDSWMFTGDGDLYVMDADGSNIRRLPVDAVTSPTWSPDGQRLAFVRDQGTSLWVINEDGSDPHVIAQDRGYYQGPAWSPTEDLIAFQSRVDAARDLTAIYTIRSDGSRERLMTPSDVNSGSPAWSHDGTQLVYSGPNEELRVLELSSGDNHPITTCSDAVCPADFAPTWSPDGTQVVFVRQESRGSTLNLYIFDLPTGTTSRVSPDLGAVGGPTWRP